MAEQSSINLDTSSLNTDASGRLGIGVLSSNLESVDLQVKDIICIGEEGGGVGGQLQFHTGNPSGNSVVLEMNASGQTDIYGASINLRDTTFIFTSGGAAKGGFLSEASDTRGAINVIPNAAYSYFAVNGNVSIGDSPSYYTTNASTGGLIVEGDTGIGIAAPTEQLHVVNGEHEYRFGSSAVLFERNNNGSGFGGAPRLIFLKTPTTPAANHVPGQLIFREDNSAAESIDWTNIYAQIIDPTDGSEDSQIAFTLFGAGLEHTFLRLRGDVKAAQFEITDTTTKGPSIDLCHVKAGGNAAEDIVGNIDWIGKDTADNDTIYGNINVYAETPTTALEDGRMEFRIMENANLTPKLYVSTVGVGVGINPTSAFHVADGSGRFAYDGSAVTSSYVLNLSQDDTGVKIGNTSSIRDMQFQINSDTKMAIATTGDVGIGTTGPNIRLDVVDTSNASQINFGDTTELEGGFLTSASPGQAIFSGGADWNGSAWTARTTTAGIIEISTSGSLNVFCDSGLTNDATFTPTKVLTALPSGRVGIGVSVPEACLHVFNSDAGVTGFVAGTDIAIESDTDSYIHIITAASNDMGLVMGHINDSADIGGAVLLKTDNALQFRAGGNTNRMTIDPTGKIGMGLINPSTNLEVAGTGTFVGHIISSTTANSGFLGFSEVAGGGTTPGYIQRYGSTHATHPNKIWHFNSADADYEFFANSTCILKIGTDGLRTVGTHNIGVGIDVPGAELHIFEAATTAQTMIIENEASADFSNIGWVEWHAHNSAAADTAYARIGGQIADNTDTTEDGRVTIQAQRAGGGFGNMLQMSPGSYEFFDSDGTVNGFCTVNIVSGTSNIASLGLGDTADNNACDFQYNNISNQLRILTNGNNIGMVITSTQDVSVGGNTAPSAKLHVDDNDGTGTLPTLTGDEVLIVQKNLNTTDDTEVAIVAGNAATSAVHFGDAQDIDAGRIVYDHGANEMSLFTTGVERMRITSDGGIGLVDGITAPATEAGYALLYVDSADGDLKIKFADGTVKTIVVDT